MTYAVNALSRVTLVRVFAEVVALGDLESFERDDLVECVCRARELLAGVAMASWSLATNARLIPWPGLES
jgi:hypothetical protein